MLKHTIRIYDDRTEYKNGEGKYHRTDGPAIEYSDGQKQWLQNGVYHRDGGPSIEYPDGTKHWYQNGQLHRTDGPAIERPNGTDRWYQNGKRHRTDGPAVEFANGDKEWWINGERLTEEEFLQRTQLTEELTLEQVCELLGKNIKIIKA